MARLSKDKNSYKAYGLAKRYEDWEHDHPRSQRKSKRNLPVEWCKGVEGTHHRFPINQKGWRHKCERCGLSQNVYKSFMKKRAIREAECGGKHVWVWQLSGHWRQYNPVSKRLRGHDRYLNRLDEDCVWYTPRMYGQDATVNEAFQNGKKIVEWEKRCAGCDTVDKTTWKIA